MATRQEIINNCKKYLGKPYVWGGENMEEGGYDCSGYAYNVMKDSGIQVYRNTANGYRNMGTKIAIADKNVSDLLFFGKNNKATHIAFYAGNGMMYESTGSSKNTKSNPGKGVILSNVSKRKDLMEVRRIADATTNTNTETTPRSWLQKGDKGEKVKTMQLMLITIGYSCGTHGADGDFGNDTYLALIKFQQGNGLTADGLYGEKSLAKLEQLYNKKISTTIVASQGYKVGQVYTLQAEMKVRKGAGTNYAAKTHFLLTKDGQKHDADGDGALDKGTRVTCKAIKKVGNDTWIQTPSGWIAAIYNGKVYVK